MEYVHRNRCCCRQQNVTSTSINFQLKLVYQISFGQTVPQATMISVFCVHISVYIISRREGRKCFCIYCNFLLSLTFISFLIVFCFGYSHFSSIQVQYILSHCTFTWNNKIVIAQDNMMGAYHLL